jgi:hypothetical protein
MIYTTCSSETSVGFQRGARTYTQEDETFHRTEFADRQYCNIISLLTFISKIREV